MLDPIFPLQFLWGSSLLVSPILEQGASERSDSLKKEKYLKTIAIIRLAYLPNSATWYDFYTGQQVTGGEVRKFL